jgi:transcriptional regulator with GAF, ATPase, and Fis domain
VSRAGRPYPFGVTDPWEQFSEVVRSVSGSQDEATNLEAILAGAAQMIPAAQHVGVSLVRRRRIVETVAATDDVVRRGDELQYELGEGPILQSIWDQETVQVDDLDADDRWPAWSRQAADGLGVRSMLCLQLFVADDNLGCLTLYSDRIGAFDAHDRTTALALAAHAAVALSAAINIEHLESAVLNRTVIGQAQGMLMQRYAMDAPAAFGVLQRVSQAQNRRLHVIAAELVEAGTAASFLQSETA